MGQLCPIWRRHFHLNPLRIIHDRNPFFLLSALSMFVGFRIILGELNSRPGDWKTLLQLIVTLNIYEVVMIALALFLITKRRLLRDGWILLGIEALFLVDLNNLNAELFTANPQLGSVVNGLCFLLAMAKILIVVRTLGLRLSPGTTLYIAAQLAFMLGLPGLFHLLRSPTATISPMQIYGVWWLAGILIACGGLLIRKTSGQSPMAALPWRLYIVVPLISLLIHLCSENRVYWVHFQSANVAPVLLGLIFALNQSRLRWHLGVFPWSVALVVLSVVISIVPEEYQPILSKPFLGLIITPFHLTLVAATGMIIYLVIRHRSLLLAQLTLAGLILGEMGYHASEIWDQVLATMHSIENFILWALPNSVMQWGYFSIAAAFALLGVGAVVSLHRVTPTPAKPEIAG